MLRKLLLGLAILLPSAAQAEWKEATSRNFVVYSEGSEAVLHDAITKLEKYDFVLRWASKATSSGSPVKLRVYLMRNVSGVQDTLPFGSSGVVGYYTASARGPVAIGTRSGSGGSNELQPEEVLLHEYAHHFMFQHFPVAYPAWYSEGFAEYYSTTRILPKDVVEVGHAALHRYQSFQGNLWLPLNKMLTAKTYDDLGGNLHLMYAQGWLLVHYLANNPERSGQLAQYLNALNAGGTYEAAMESAFGPDARKLNSELRDYAFKRRLNAVRLPFKPIDTGPIEVRTLPPAQQALVGFEIRLARGLLAREAAAFAGQVRPIAARFPNDPYALSILTEAERAAGNDAAAAAAAERWLAVQPKAARALMHKGSLRIGALAAARSTDESAWSDARKLILEAHKAAPKDPMILEAYYDSFTAQGVLPPAGAQNGLVRAFELVPQDGGLRYKVAADFEKRGMIPEAIATIKPAALQLHAPDSEDPKKKAKRERAEEKYREAGKARTETAPEMLARLTKLAESGGQQAAAASN